VSKYKHTHSKKQNDEKFPQDRNPHSRHLIPLATMYLFPVEVERQRSKKKIWLHSEILIIDCFW